MSSLRDLGLSEYEARTYRALLRTGSTTAKELSTVSDVPMGRIYDVLSSLEEREVVRSQTASRPKRYAAVEPEPALNRLVAARQAELEERAEEYEATAERLRSDLGDRAAPTEEGFWTAAVGPEDAADLLVERLGAAEERIVVVAGGLSAKFDIGDIGDRLSTEFAGALDRGVEVSVLMSPDIVASLPDDIAERYNEELATHPAFEARLAEGIEGSFNTLDRREVCIEVPNPLAPEETFALIDLQDRGFASDVRDVFEPRWAQAESLTLE
jgi:sugar-specific transcriptional regulator TrmB